MKAKTIFSTIMVFTLCIILPSAAYAQGTKEDYERAEKLLPANIKKYVFKLRVEPHWIESSDSFWYRNDTRDEKEFLFVDPVHNTIYADQPLTIQSLPRRSRWQQVLSI